MIKKIGQYEIKRLLGQGGIAQIHLCTQDTQSYALKICSKPSTAKYIRQEYEVLKKLRHPNIVKVFSMGTAQEHAFYVMEALDGVSGQVFAEHIQRLPPSERHAIVMSIATQITQALIYIHNQQYLHRDVKPSNILCSSKLHCTLIDFGTACLIESSQSDILMGTPTYASPEQLDCKKLLPQSDQFSLGATLYYLLLNKKPFVGKDRSPPPKPSVLDPTVPENLEIGILKMLEYNPEDRFSSLNEFLILLQQIELETMPLAGRQDILKEISMIIQRVLAGEQIGIQLLGTRGSGKTWVCNTILKSTKRHNITVLEITKNTNIKEVLHIITQREPLLVIHHLNEVQPLGIPHIVIPIPLLSLAEVRRSIHAHAPKTVELSKEAEHLHRLSGGLPALIIPLLTIFTTDNVFTLANANIPYEIAMDFFDTVTDLDWKILYIIALHHPIQTLDIQELFLTDIEENLSRLTQLSLIHESHFGWKISNELFLQTIQQQKDFSTELFLSQTKETIDFKNEFFKTIQKSSKGSLAEAKNDAQYLLEGAHNQESRSIALLTLGQVYLDMGMWKEADHVLADSTALSKAIQQNWVYEYSQTLRARLSLEKHQSSSHSAHQAMDRLLPFLQSTNPLVMATWAWAIAALGDRNAWKKTSAKSIENLKNFNGIIQIRCYFSLIRGASAIGDFKQANQLIQLILPQSKQFDLLHWEIARADSLINNKIPPVTGHLAYDLNPHELLMLKRRWIRAKGLSPDPTWNN